MCEGESHASWGERMEASYRVRSHMGIAPDASRKALARARLLAGLSATPLRDSIDVVVLSDHGMADAPQSKAIPIQPLLVAAAVDASLVKMGDDGPTM